ncbi:proteinaceous RNase P 2 [Mercurialis annua]|uniref:proteinaceous RNase P 2 n=1 Tax=Mercurialis annua TaxID=3986 RepID=UPI00215EB50B|nr:proteinaceous RNase P 2 [Mercurialis annua]XP_050229381.1 proteinaceous RNase P 2 [Mercurialis annua]XP_050229387.1 proteinaceous RNase P 2 [Mercurialis annua]
MASTNTTTKTTDKNKPNNNKKKQTPESQFNYNLNFYSKSKDLQSAISLYKSAILNKIHLNQHHFNTLLYLCSISLNDSSKKDLALEYGFVIFDHMVKINCIKPNEASITAVARLAAAKGDGDYAFNLVKDMGVYNELPRLRTYDPVLLCFCEKLEAVKAYEVEDHMLSMGVDLEELEISALLKVSIGTRNEERVYGYLQKLRKTVRCVKEETAKIIEDWFNGFEANGKELDVSLVREAVSRNGGGWHGIGWIGKGKWEVKRGNVDMDGKCCCCGDHMACADIGDMETENFALSLAGFAMEREVKANFREFQDWLDRNASYEAIVDGANIGLYQQNFAEGEFSISQLDAVVKELYDQSGKWPLIVLHSKRVRALLENPSQRNLIQEWMEKDVLYTTPHGSNDDWYWLYAAVKLRCLLVTNDEMRDHIFELLGSSFFLKWKERHQVRYTFVKGNLKLEMPPPFSVVIQESEKGSWHVPITSDGNEDSAQNWVCITRPSACDAPHKDETSQNGHHACVGKSLKPCEPNGITKKIDSEDSFIHSENKPATLTGKRKERSTCQLNLELDK